MITGKQVADVICIHYRVSLNFDHKNNKGLKHSDEETRKERTKAKEKGKKRNRQEEEEEQRRKVNRGRKLKSKTRIPQRTNVYYPCSAEVNQCESN